MFCASIVLNKVCRVHYKEIIRHNRRFTGIKRSQKDPGIKHRKQLLQDNEQVQELADHDFDLEADFMNVGVSDSQHMQEMELRKKREKYLIVKRKYFQEKLPNFLTWGEKQQIRHLYRTDPEEWTKEKLSDGFPALPSVIEKIATSNWAKESESRIHNHDEAVKKNWRSFKAGKFTELPPDLVEHLEKFGTRDLNFKPFDVSNTDINTKKSMIAPNIKIGNEFSSIITSYERLKNKNAPELLKPNQHNIEKPPKRDTYMPQNVTYSQHVTLDKLRENVETKSKMKNVSEDEQLILNAFEEQAQNTANTIEPVDSIPQVVDHIKEDSSKNNNVSVVVKNKKDYYHLEYPEKITIPKGVFKPGYTYKLNDCYYDDDGEFLYRVPGMYK